MLEQMDGELDREHHSLGVINIPAEAKEMIDKSI